MTQHSSQPIGCPEVVSGLLQDRPRPPCGLPTAGSGAPVRPKVHASRAFPNHCSIRLQDSSMLVSHLCAGRFLTLCPGLFAELSSCNALQECSTMKASNEVETEPAETV